MIGRVDDKYLWAKNLMPIVYELGTQLPKSKNKLLISLPLTWETLCLIDAIRRKIKLVVIPLTSGKNSSLQPEVFKYLRRWKVKYFDKATDNNRVLALKLKPDIILDCIFSVSTIGLSKKLINPYTLLIEDTRTGSIRLQEALKKFKFPNPYFVLDDYDYKRRYENRIGIGYSVVASLAASGILLKGKEITIIGFGPIGQGLAKFSKGIGATVNVVEIDKVKLKLAKKSYTTGTIENFIKTSDIFITATGDYNIIKKEDLQKMKDGAMLVNAGADFGEWDQKYLHTKKAIKLTENVISYSISKNKHVIELGGGNSFNLVSGISVSSFLDITFSLAIQAIRQFTEGKTKKSGEIKINPKYLEDLDKKINKFIKLG